MLGGPGGCGVGGFVPVPGRVPGGEPGGSWAGFDGGRGGGWTEFDGGGCFDPHRISSDMFLLARGGGAFLGDRALAVDGFSFHLIAWGSSPFDRFRHGRVRGVP